MAQIIIAKDFRVYITPERGSDPSQRVQFRDVINWSVGKRGELLVEDQDDLYCFAAGGWFGFRLEGRHHRPLP